MNSIDKLLLKYLSSKKSINEFLENIESTDISATPESSPYPSKKDKEDEEEKED